MPCTPVIVGCGYVGKAVAKHWSELGYSVVATTRNRQNDLKDIVEEIVTLTPDYERSLSLALLKGDTLLLSIAPDTREKYRETYLETAKLIKKHLPNSLKQVIYTSSCSVYGDHQGQEVTEETPCSPSTPHSEILLETEQVLQSLDCSVCIFRLGEIIGPSRTVLDKLKRLDGGTLPGDGMNPCNFSPLGHIVQGIHLAAEKRLSGIYNLCSDLHPLRKLLYDNLCHENEITAPRWDPSKKSIHSGNKIVNSDKFKEII